MVAYQATRDLIPLYAVYALYFRDHGISPAAISSLLVLWSLTAFVLEIPSGAWADTVDRRRLLVLGGVLYVAAFATWMLRPSYAGIAVGFVLWGASTALASGTFEALLVDELSARDAAADYPRVLAQSQAAAMAAMVLATFAATPLLALGGYAAVGWTSVAVALVHTGCALLLPRAPVVAPAEEAPGRRYVDQLRAGVGEALRERRARGAVVVVALVVGCSAYDEYVGLVARQHGVATADVPVVVGLVVVGQLVGTALAGRTAGMGPRTMGVLVAVSAVLLSLGALAGSAVLLTGGLAVGYGLLSNAMLVAEARLQAVITGPARATVTSVAGVSTEVTAVAVYAFVGLGATWWSTATAIALWGIPVVGFGVVAARLLPRAEA